MLGLTLAHLAQQRTAFNPALGPFRGIAPSPGCWTHYTVGQSLDELLWLSLGNIIVCGRKPLFWGCTTLVHIVVMDCHVFFESYR